MATAAQAAASRVNGALSHGPTSEEGKATSSLNALKTGLTGRTVLLLSEDAALYEAHLAQFRERCQPVGDQELALVQRPRILETESRLNEAAKLYIAAVHANQHDLFDPEALGFLRKYKVATRGIMELQRCIQTRVLWRPRLTGRSGGECPACRGGAYGGG